ncbi:MAG: hypothetical protein HYU84_16065, partial [Chloroflexi bacterium]|nr:hypothetical protein [Chloroflexota bacterium]
MFRSGHTSRASIDPMVVLPEPDTPITMIAFAMFFYGIYVAIRTHASTTRGKSIRAPLSAAAALS